LDYVERLPPERVPLTAVVATLAAQEDLHPGLVNRLVCAAERIHSRSDVLSDQLKFSMAEGTELPMNPQAAETLATGLTRQEELVPYWMSAQICKMAIFVVPLLFLLLPIGQALPGIYAWRMRSRVHRHYRDLLSVEAELHREDLSAKDARTLAHQLDGSDSAVERLNMPLRYCETVFALRMHVDLVRKRLLERLGPKG